jgi:hypothetical protein
MTLMMPDRSWTRSGIGEALYTDLATGLRASELWSLLLDVFAARAAERTPASLLRQWGRDTFTRPASVDQRTLVALDGHLLAAANGFEAIELSPLAPLGACSTISLASQNKIVSSLRGTEVVADPTNVLALECAMRLQADATAIIRLATCHRAVRAQQVPKQPGFAQHFGIFCLATAGHEQKDHGFTVAHVLEHILTHVTALDRLEQHGYAFPDRRIKVLATQERAELGNRIAAAIQDMSVMREPLDHPYYDGVRFMISARSRDGDPIRLIDGGAFDWMGKLMSNRKMVLVASGMGSQVAAYAFRQ